MKHLKMIIILTSFLATLWVVPVQSQTGWTAMSSPTSKILRSVWGNSGTDVFAVGDDGVILHYDGSGWGISSRVLYQFAGVWGTSGTNVLTVGTLLSSSGVVQRYDGSTWSSMTSWGYPLSCIWGSSATDIFAGGFNTILHYNGSGWTNMYDSSQSNDYFLSVWGSSGTDVFAAGARSIQHYNGTAWTAMSIPTSNTLRGLWGSSGTNVFAVGDIGTILHYDGTSWSAIPGNDGIWRSIGGPVVYYQTYTNNSAMCIVSSDGKNIIAAYAAKVENGMFDGVDLGNGGKRYRVQVAFSSPTQASCTVTELTTGIVQWNALTRDPGEISQTMADEDGIWRSSPDDGQRFYLQIYKNGGGLLLRSNDALTGEVFWDPAPTATKFQGQDIYSPHQASVVFTMAYGITGQVVRTPVSGSPQIWAATSFSRAIPGLTASSLAGIWGSSGTDIFAVGTSGTVLHYDGKLWTAMTSNATKTLNAVWGSSNSNVFAGGEDGTIMHYTSK
ncbi:MAG: hypothetical protein HQK57_05250 [Deltaproteobacteria bacterium]|nr:hypothetical protein [Deltaproteobacteria bacterium]